MTKKEEDKILANNVYFIIKESKTGLTIAEIEEKLNDYGFFVTRQKLTTIIKLLEYKKI